MKVVTVVPLEKGSNKSNLTYFSVKDIQIGSIVSVPLRAKKILGLVISAENISDAKMDVKGMNFKLKRVVEVKERSTFLKEYLEAVVDSSRYFASTENSAMAALIPSIFKEEYDKITKFKNETENNAATAILSEKRKTVEKFLLQEPIEDRLAVYKTLIRENFALKKSVFIVLPTEHDIKIFEKSLSRGIEQFTFSLHSGLSKKKIMQKLENAITAKHGVLILGTAPFLAIPREDIEVVILEHESSSAYKTIARPRFDLRIFAELFANKIGAKFILNDTLLRFETIGRGEIESITPMHPLSFRINLEGKLEILGRNSERAASEKLASQTGGFKILLDETVGEIQNAIKKKKNVFIFSLRKGLATQTLCRDCGELLSCERCGAPLVLYLSHEGKKKMFICNRCEREANADIVCRTCGSWNLIPLGIGTDTVAEELKNLFPKEKILKLDKETARNAKGAEMIAKEFQNSSGAILVGTEMAFSHLENKVPLSIIASFDSLWSIPSFKMSEKIIQTAISIISLTEKKFIIQTKNEKDPVLLAIKGGNLLPFVREELSDRKKLNYPPYKRFIKITYLGSKEETAKAKKTLEEIFGDYTPEIFAGFVDKLKDKFVTNCLIRIEPKRWSLPELLPNSFIDEPLRAKLLSLPPNFEVVVDPEDLL